MNRPARWILPAAHEGGADELARLCGLSGPAARVLWGRGTRTAADVERFLAPGLADLHDPLLMRGMDRAVARIAAAIAAKEKILLYGDYDVDGTVSVVVLKKALELAGSPAEHFVPNRLRDGYGMRPEVVEEQARAGVKLIISVDTGIRAGAVVERARELGVDVIVTDHHLPEAELPRAVAVLNPNQPGCAYPEKNLCGAGVALKLVQALLPAIGVAPGRASALIASFLKLVALATVADVVPLTGENRTIVKLGLGSYSDIRNPGLRALLEVAGFAPGKCPSAREVAFQLAPRVNAAGRMEDAMDAIDMFLTGDLDRARSLAAELNARNRARQEAEREMLAAIEERCAAEPVTDAHGALVFSGPQWHRGVVGIVASRVVDRWHRPAFVLSEDLDTGLATGSARSVPGFHLLEALESMPELFTKFGGHRQAAGLTLPLDSIGEFRRRMSEYVLARIPPADFCRLFEPDAELSLAEINDRTAADVLALAPFGCGNPEPLFLLSGAEVCGPCQRIGNAESSRHLNVPLRHAGRMLMMKAWDFAERAAEIPPGTRVDALVSIQEDEYCRSRGLPAWRLTLRDVRAAAASQVVAASIV